MIDRVGLGSSPPFTLLDSARIGTVADRDPPYREIKLARNSVDIFVNQGFLLSCSAKHRRYIRRVRWTAERSVCGAVEFEVGRALRTANLVESFISIRSVNRIVDIFLKIRVGDSVVEAEGFGQHEVGAFHPPDASETEVGR